MKRLSLSLLLIASLLAALPLRTLPQSQSKPQQRPVAVTTTTSVLVDVVVKDKRGVAVRDMTKDEFEVYEDGVKQQVDYFERISRTIATPAAEVKEAPAEPRAAPAAAPPPAAAQPGVVAIVFDRLTTDARVRARNAAASYLGEPAAALNAFVGVFQINLSLTTVQNFTTDPKLAMQGIDKASAMVSSSFESNTLRVAGEDAMLLRQNSMAQSVAAAGQSNPSAGGAAGAAMADQMMQQMQSRMQETFEQLQRDQQGYATTNGLMALVNTMQRLPGRKAVIFFSEGLALPPNVQQHFRSVINAANRANVSIYAVDAAGLRTESTLAASRDEINARSRRRMDNLDRAASNTDGPLTKGLERNEDLLQLNPQNGLSQLAAETGGTFIGNTNQIGPKLREVDDDLSSYYLMSYVSANENYDGKFRNITVKVKRGGVDFLARKGYYAVPPTGSTPMFYYEAQPLAALSRGTPPREFPLLLTGLHFPENGRPGRVAVEVEAPASAFTFVNDAEKKVYTTDFSFVVLVRDQQSHQVVEKLSYHYALVGPSDGATALKKTKILFYRDINLPPGKYQLEAVAFDAVSSKASVKHGLLEVPEAEEGQLRLSSVALIQRAEQIKEKLESPFRLGEVLIYPNLGEPIHKSARQMGFYFNVYPAKGATETPKLTLELAQNDKTIAQIPLKLPPADETGRIQYASALPLDSLSPGPFELRAIVSDGKRTLRRSAAFTLEP